MVSTSDGDARFWAQFASKCALVRSAVVPALLVAGIIATGLVAASPSSDAASLVEQQVWSKDSGETWRTLRTGQELDNGWYNVGYNDAGWSNVTMLDYTSHGGVPDGGQRGYYFRKEFEVSDAIQLVDMKVDFYYDDAAVLFLNGQEVYRTIRGNLPGALNQFGELSIFQSIPYGGAEDYYVQIPGRNSCEQGCSSVTLDSIPVDLLNEGTNVFAMMVWTTPNSDLGADLALSLTRDLEVAPEPIVISEIAATNDGSVLDEDGDDSDWFELHNEGPNTVDLAGWEIQDSGATWTFPSVSIPSDGYLLVYASDKDRSNGPNGELHTNFKLSKDGDSLTLVDDASLVVDQFGIDELPLQFSNVSYGVAPDGSIGYLASLTPGAANSGLGSGYDPVLRDFSDRIHNVGEPVDEQPVAFDPDGGGLTYTMAPPIPGIGIDPNSGAITGTATTAGSYTPTLTVTDENGQTASAPLTWHVIAAPAQPAALVLNEYNAVGSAADFAGQPDPAFGNLVGNGGDWLEFVVTQDFLDLRGWTIELWNSTSDDLLALDDTLRFADRAELSSLRSGTILTISEDRATDLSFDPGNGDWHINIQSNDPLEGEPDGFFVDEQDYNTTHKSLNVVIRDAGGAVVSPAVGETAAWDDANGGVGSVEVFSMCVNPSGSVDPIGGYDDNASFSTYGTENTCRIGAVDSTQNHWGLRGWFGPDPEPFEGQIIPTGATWSYLDDGSDQGTAWRAASYDDASWSSGPAELGFGDGDEATIVDFGPNAAAKHITTYFRRAFSAHALDHVDTVDLEMKVDDGAVVYLNGTEIWRINMPAGNIAYDTYSGDNTNEVDYIPLSLSQAQRDLLVDGVNVLAVEVHQKTAGSSDLSFDFGMSVTASVPQSAQLGDSVTYSDGSVATGVSVDLYAADVDGNRLGYLRSASTGAAGDYGFIVDPGCYAVTFVAPVGQLFVDGNEYFTTATCVVGGGVDNTLDAVLATPGGGDTSVGGSVMFADGSTATGVSVDLFSADAAGERIVWLSGTSSGADGSFAFDVAAGCYSVVVIAPAGELFVGGGGFWERAVCVADGEVNSSVNAVLQSAGAGQSIGDSVMFTDGTPAVGVSIDLFGADAALNKGEWQSFTASGADGSYTFDVAVGCYVVVFIAPAGEVFANGTGFLERGVCLVAGQSDDTIDAVLQSAGGGQSIGDSVTAADGSGVAGVAIDLFASDGVGNRAQWLASTSTDASGVYGFDVAVGCYVVVFIAPAGEMFVGGGEFYEQPLCIAADEVNDSIDAQLAGEGGPSAGIGDLVADGAGGVGGVAVDLYGANADGSRAEWITATTSGVDGSYGFAVAPACYVVVFVAPDGRTFVNGTAWHEVSFCVADGETNNDIDATLN